MLRGQAEKGGSPPRGQRGVTIQHGSRQARAENTEDPRTALLHQARPQAQRHANFNWPRACSSMRLHVLQGRIEWPPGMSPSPAKNAL